MLIGSTGFGLEFPTINSVPGAFVIDDTADAAPSGQTMLNGQVVMTRADDPAWRGILVRAGRMVSVTLRPCDSLTLRPATRHPPTRKCFRN